jgi:hypothetical protein
LRRWLRAVAYLADTRTDDDDADAHAGRRISGTIA